MNYEYINFFKALSADYNYAIVLQNKVRCLSDSIKEYTNIKGIPISCRMIKSPTKEISVILLAYKQMIVQSKLLAKNLFIFLVKIE